MTSFTILRHICKYFYTFVDGFQLKYCQVNNCDDHDITIIMDQNINITYPYLIALTP